MGCGPTRGRPFLFTFTFIPFPLFRDKIHSRFTVEKEKGEEECKLHRNRNWKIWRLISQWLSFFLLPFLWECTNFQFEYIYIAYFSLLIFRPVFVQSEDQLRSILIPIMGTLSNWIYFKYNGIVSKIYANIVNDDNFPPMVPHYTDPKLNVSRRNWTETSVIYSYIYIIHREF